MKRRLLILALSLGTFVGFGSGFASLAHHHHDRRAEFEQHVADICVDAAQRADDEQSCGCGHADYDEPPPPPRRGHRPHGHWHGYGR